MNKGIIIYGNGDFAELMKYCIDNDDDREIKKIEYYISSSEDVEILICVDYSSMNDNKKGYLKIARIFIG